MHGLIVRQFGEYVLAKHGTPRWREIATAAGEDFLDTPANLDRIFPDPVVMQLIGTAAKVLGMPPPLLVEDFGEFLAPTLLALEPRSIRPEWRTLDVIEHAEQHIHTVVRARDPDAGPPYLKARRNSPDEVEVVYTSKRRLCVLAEGIARGLAKHFGERIAITQPECMHAGAARCLIVVRRLA